MQLTTPDSQPSQPSVQPMDPLFQVEVLAQTPHPQQSIYAAMHQDYAEAFVWDERDRFPVETRAGELVVKNLLAGGRGHYGPLEHPQITLNCGYFPHSTMQQMRTHRVGVSFDVQCLAADTEITFVQDSGELRKITIARLYDLWANGEMAARLRQMNLRVLNEATGIFETSQIQTVFDKGIQPVYRLTLEDGRTLDCTTNHRLLTSTGWQTMATALQLITDLTGQVVSHRQDCELLTNGVAVSEELCREKAWLEAHPLRVAQVKYLGLQRTYDLEVAGEWHNFVANGVVVHNSFRYTGSRILDVADGKRPVEEVFYLRPLGSYTDRQGKHYEYTEALRQQDLDWCFTASKRYQERIQQGFSEEHARGLIPFDVRQHWVLSANVRSMMHLLDLRWKGDAQLECQHLCELIWPHFQAWVPEVAAWYEANRLKKARLSP